MNTARVRRTNREIERFYFEGFRNACLLPPGDIVYSDKPDIILAGARRIGIEITNFFLKPGSGVGNEQQQKSERSWVVARAYELYRCNGGRGIDLTVALNPTCPISLERRCILANELAELARSNDKATSGPLPTVIPELSTIYINTEEHSDARWCAKIFRNPKPLSAEQLQSIIRKKELRLLDIHHVTLTGYL